MNKERELLERSIELIDQYWDDSKVGYPRDADNRKLFYEIEELLAQPEKTEQDPVAWMWTRNYEGGGYTNKVFEFLNDAEEYAKDSKTLKSPDIIRPLYASPPKRESLTPRQGLEEYKKGYARAEIDLKREPLSDEEIHKLSLENFKGLLSDRINFVRAIEKEHGITGGGE